MNATAITMNRNIPMCKTIDAHLPVPLRIEHRNIINPMRYIG